VAFRGWATDHKPIKTAIVSREDEAGLTRRRIKKLIGGRREYSNLEDKMMVNTRHHQADFKVTRDDHMDALIEQLGRFGAELVVLDVFRSIHDGEENDNTEVAKVLAKVSRIQLELKCACALVHHIAKVDGTDIFKGLRGASAIHGWMEWGIGISVTNRKEEDRAQRSRRNRRFTAPHGCGSLVTRTMRKMRQRRAGSQGTSSRRDPVMSDPEPSPNQQQGSQSQHVRAGEPSHLRPEAGFGRFQGSGG